MERTPFQKATLRRGYMCQHCKMTDQECTYTLRLIGHVLVVIAIRVPLTNKGSLLACSILGECSLKFPLRYRRPHLLMYLWLSTLIISPHCRWINVPLRGISITLLLMFARYNSCNIARKAHYCSLLTVPVHCNAWSCFHIQLLQLYCHIFTLRVKDKFCQEQFQCQLYCIEIITPAVYFKVL